MSKGFRKSLEISGVGYRVAKSGDKLTLSLEMCIRDSIKRGGKVWIKVFPDKPATKKPAEVRMGSGKGNPEFWVAVVRPGRVLFELSGVAPAVAREALERAAAKLPIGTKIVSREETS